MNKLIIFPTDTVYGIGACLYDKENINKIYEIKGRDFNKQIPVLCSTIEQIETFAVVNDNLRKLAKAFWPGALTIVLESNNDYYNFSGEKTIAIRIPNHKETLKLLEKYGPLKTTSINKSGEPPLNDYKVIYERYNDVVDHIYMNNEEMILVASTIISLVDEVKLLRTGSISYEDILKSLI